MRLLPKKVCLGPGWEVKVRMVEPGVMEAAFDRDTAGIWDKKEKTILILKNLSRERKWSVFCEELAHALIDKLAEMGH